MIARKLRITLSDFLIRANIIFARYFGAGRFCCACQSSIGKFLPYRRGSKDRASLMRALEVVGSDVDNFSCPRCWSHDRERHLILYFNELNIWDNFRNRRVLHFAPEKKLSELIVSLQPSQYLKADLFPKTEDVEKVDICTIPFEDDYFDIVIANHVLEHVDDLDCALSEITRVIKNKGYVILQTPYSQKLNNTFSDAGINSDLARREAYGQEDHVRLFGLDVYEKIMSFGLVSAVKGHDEVLSKIDPKKYGVNPCEKLMMFVSTK